MCPGDRRDPERKWVWAISGEGDTDFLRLSLLRWLGGRKAEQVGSPHRCVNTQCPLQSHGGFRSAIWTLVTGPGDTPTCCSPLSCDTVVLSLVLSLHQLTSLSSSPHLLASTYEGIMRIVISLSLFFCIAEIFFLRLGPPQKQF